MRCVFLAELRHKLNVIFHISTYTIWEFSNPTDTSDKNVILRGGITELAGLNYLCIYTLYYFAENESTFPFQYSIIFETVLLSPLAPLLRKIDKCAH